MKALSGIYVHTLVMIGLAVLQSTLFRYGVVAGVTPDMVMLVLIHTANHHGSFKGQVSGFVAGLVQDLISLAPLGYNAFVRTVIGFLYGLFRGKLFVDPIFAPIVMAAIATILKALMSFVLFSMFAPDHAGTAFAARFAVELGLNCVLSPFVYAILRAVGMIRTATSRGA
jgi:rod shape-determining protein MreD